MFSLMHKLIARCKSFEFTSQNIIHVPLQRHSMSLSDVAMHHRKTFSITPRMKTRCAAKKKRKLNSVKRFPVVAGHTSDKIYDSLKCNA
jgi:hypothetical protein